MKQLIIPALLLALMVQLTGQSNIAFLELPDRPVPAPHVELATAGVSDFLLIKNFCLIPANLDGQSGYFILDTGAPGLVLNKTSEQGLSHKGVSCTQSLQVGTTTVVELEWAGRTERHIEAYTLPMPHLTASTGENILGLIGYDLLRDYEMLLDYDLQRLMIFPAEQNELHRGISPQQEVHFTMFEHLPILELEVDGKKYRFGLDTGAASNLISKEVSKLLNLDHSLTQKEELQGLDGHIQVVNKIVASGLEMGGQALPIMSYLVQDLQHLSVLSDWQLDGLLGAPLLQSWTTSINFPKQKFYIWEKK